MSQWQPYLIAMIVGLLIGIEREKAHPDQDTMGIRTFLLISLLGSLAGGLQTPWLAVVLAVFCMGLILTSYFFQSRMDDKKADLGLTTEFAGALVFCLGYAAHFIPTVAAILGPMVALILFSKTALHRFSHSIKPIELETALLLLLAGVVVINLVPDKAVDPWDVFNPHQFGILILTLATLEFSSYALVKIIGEKKGTLLVGFLGGLVSSTAVLLSSAKQAKRAPESWRTLASSALAAKLAALAELLLIVGLISTDLLLHVLAPILAALLAGGLILFILAWKSNGHDSGLALKSPLDWPGVLRLSLILGAILAALSLAEVWLGNQGTLVLSFVTGLFELHGVSLANATMFSQKQLGLETAKVSILLAAIASLVAKIAISWSIERKAFARTITAAFLPMAAVIVAIAWIQW